ncbi:Protein transport protein Sec61 subunit gamma [Rhynchospora pubera]|uniref:Protein transport protein Sec61 subunit gamma n=2 Tax=Mesangiospermae TaxID=1437183 RepID=A0AAV8CJH5_9POAL|nr:Protein transport protein Sec61 subunit gamma [Rhynchospora pubera]
MFCGPILNQIRPSYNPRSTFNIFGSSHHKLPKTLIATVLSFFPLFSRKKKTKESRKMDAIDSVADPLREFAKDSIRLVKRCHKPDRKGFFTSPFRFKFSKVAVRTAIGFVVMGFVGFFVKLIFIPINNIIVGSG